MSELSLGRQVLGLVVCVVVVFAAATLGGLFTKEANSDWYRGLIKPLGTPPNWVFAPVWTTLYVLMAVAAWLVWRKGGFGARRLALALFLVQLALNAAWSPIFFGLGAFGWAFVEIALLWGAILATMVTFARASALAGCLMLPYILWVTWAARLNFWIWRLNP